jgi:hypothetical protein
VTGAPPRAAIRPRVDPAILNDGQGEPVDLALRHLRLNEGVELVGRGPDGQRENGGRGQQNDPGE